MVSSSRLHLLAVAAAALGGPGLMACGDDGGFTVLTVDAAVDGAPDHCPAPLSLCNPLAVAGQQACPTGQKCTWIVVRDDAGDRWGVIGCAPDGLAERGEACAIGPPGPTSGFDDCRAGNYCFGGTCEDLCGFGGGAQEACAAGLECAPVAGTWSNCGADPMFGACVPRTIR